MGQRQARKKPAIAQNTTTVSKWIRASYLQLYGNNEDQERTLVVRHKPIRDYLHFKETTSKQELYMNLKTYDSRNQNISQTLIFEIYYFQNQCFRNQTLKHEKVM